MATDDRRRLQLALLLSALVNGLIWAWPKPSNGPEEQPEKPQPAVIVRIETRPTPSPTPRPTNTPQIIASPHIVTTPVPHPAPKRAMHKEAKPRPFVASHYHRVVVDIPILRHGNASGSGRQGTGTGAGGQSVGPGTGSGGNGNGTGGVASNEPCGYVEFKPNRDPSTDKSSGVVSESITMTVYFPDGSAQEVDLDWPFRYPNESADPWSDQNIRKKDFPVLFQDPPPDRAGGEPSLVQYVIAHSTAQGYTKLQDCPKSP